MRHARAAWALLAALLLLPPAAADEPLLAGAMTLSGQTSLEGDAAALFFVLENAEALEWELTASEGTLVRDYVVDAAVDHPLNPGSYAYTAEKDRGRETLPLAGLSITSLGGTAGGALLAKALDATASAASTGTVRVVSQTDPLVSQYGPADVRTGETAGIEERIPGDQLVVDLSDGSLTLRGDLVLELFGPSYELTTADGSRTFRTGEFEGTRTGPTSDLHTEHHELTLVGAVLQVRSLQPVTLFTRFPTVDVAGSIEPAGGAPIPTDARFQLSPYAGRVSAASAPPVVAAGGALVPRAPVPALVALTAAGVAVGALAVVLLARRGERGDDLELALLAMEERRWGDALPRLERLAKRRPADAGLQIDRALCLEQVGRFEDAAKAFETALRVAPRHAEAHFYYARTLAKMRETEAARVHLETALERDPRLVEMMRSETVLRGL